MRNLILASLFCFVPAFASAELVRSLQHDTEHNEWSLAVPGWTATLSSGSSEDMTAKLELHNESGEAMSAMIDMMGQNLPSLINVEEAFVCGDQLGVAVTTADLTPEGNNGLFVYRRFVFSAGKGFIGELIDDASSAAGGALPFAVVVENAQGLCEGR